MTDSMEKESTDGKELYLRKILEHYQKERYSSLKLYLAEPTSGTIRDKLISLLNLGENPDLENAIKGFLDKRKVESRKELIEIVNDNVHKFRAIQRLLLGDSKNGSNNIDLLHITAFLVELNDNEYVETSVTSQRNISAVKTNEIKQFNILGISNSSLIKKIKGRIFQLNILGFGNKQEVIDNN